jgi:sugar/nucleoside kinase (ribokinase family)
MSTKTFDLCQNGCPTPFVFTDRGAAERIKAAFEAEKAHLFQAEGVKFTVVKSDRAGVASAEVEAPPPPPPSVDETPADPVP